MEPRVCIGRCMPSRHGAPHVQIVTRHGTEPAATRRNCSMLRRRGAEEAGSVRRGLRRQRRAPQLVTNRPSMNNGTAKQEHATRGFSEGIKEKARHDDDAACGEAEQRSDETEDGAESAVPTKWTIVQDHDMMVSLTRGMPSPTRRGRAGSPSGQRLGICTFPCGRTPSPRQCPETNSTKVANRTTPIYRLLHLQLYTCYSANHTSIDPCDKTEWTNRGKSTRKHSITRR